MKTPAREGYSMPAEWEKHEATWISWPKDPSTFPGAILPSVERAYVELVECLSKGEEVRILVDDEKAESRVKGLLKPGSKASFYRIKSVDVWTRDYAPVYVKGQDMAIVRWKFNAWGGKYDDLLPDDTTGNMIAESTGLRTFRPGMVLEGGSIDVNGEGTLLTTEQCLLNRNRNPGMGRGSIEEALKSFLGVKKVIWLHEGIEGDDTDGHVDDIARFVGPRKIVIAAEKNRDDANHRVLLDDLSVITSSTDQDGKEFEVITIPMPDPVGSTDGRLPASHLNFYIGNACVAVPTFGSKSDKKALQTIGKLFPEREVRGIDCRHLVYGLGTLHCVTQQVPRVYH